MICSVFSCSSQEHQTSQLKDHQAVFFDLDAYFDSEMKRLSGSDLALTKVANLNGKEEKIAPQILDYQEELKVFRQSDINRLSWLDKYQSDTLSEAGKITKIVYTALEDKLKTKKIEILYDKDAVSSIAIENSSSSLVASGRQKLMYQPQSGYSIDNEQKILFGNKRHLHVAVSFSD